MVNGRINKKHFIDCHDCWKNDNPRNNVGGGDPKDNADANAVSFSIDVVHVTPNIPSVLTK